VLLKGILKIILLMYKAKNFVILWQLSQMKRRLDYCSSVLCKDGRCENWSHCILVWYQPVFG
jgi:hypothetical protein